MVDYKRNDIASLTVQKCYVVAPETPHESAVNFNKWDKYFFYKTNHILNHYNNATMVNVLVSTSKTNFPWVYFRDCQNIYITILAFYRGLVNDFVTLEKE